MGLRVFTLAMYKLFEQDKSTIKEVLRLGSLRGYKESIGINETYARINVTKAFNRLKKAIPELQTIPFGEGHKYKTIRQLVLFKQHILDVFHVAVDKIPNRELDPKDGGMDGEGNWTMPKWMTPYVGTFVYTGGNDLTDLMNDKTTSSASDPLRALIIASVVAQVGMLTKLYNSGRLL